MHCKAHKVVPQLKYYNAIPNSRALVVWRWTLDTTYSMFRTHNIGAFRAFMMKLFFRPAVKKVGYYVGMGRNTPEEIFKLAKEDCQVRKTIQPS